MIREQHPFALQYVAPDTVKLLIDVVYESATDIPFDGIGFKTMQEVEEFMKQNKLNYYEDKEMHILNP